MRCLVLTVIAIVMAFPAQAADRPLQTVASVDLERYSGKWFEIGRLPNRFQKDCTGATAEYALRDDGMVSVLNTCFREDGTTRSIRGHATPRDGSSNAKLRVRFDGLFFTLFSWLIKADYWVVDLAGDYSWALVGTPNRDYLWILARERTMDESTYESIVDVAAAQGFDTERILRTEVPAETP